MGCGASGAVQPPPPSAAPLLCPVDEGPAAAASSTTVGAIADGAGGSPADDDAPAADDSPSQGSPAKGAHADSGALRLAGDVDRVEAASAVASKQDGSLDQGPRENLQSDAQLDSEFAELRLSADALQPVAANTSASTPAAGSTSHPASPDIAVPRISVMASEQAASAEAPNGDSFQAADGSSVISPHTDFNLTYGGPLDLESAAGDSVGELVMQEIEQILGEVDTPKIALDVVRRNLSEEGSEHRVGQEPGLFAELITLSLHPTHEELRTLSRQFADTQRESPSLVTSDKQGSHIGVFYATCATVGNAPAGPLTADDELMMQDILDGSGSM